MGDLLNFELCTPQGNTLFRLHVDASGKCQIYGVNGVDINSGAQRTGGHREVHTGDSTREVQGTVTQVVGNDHSITVGGSQTTSISGDNVQSASNDTILAAARDMGLQAGGDATWTIQDSLTFDIEEGAWKADLNMGNIEFTTRVGDIQFESTAGGNIKLDTRTGDIETSSRKITFATQGTDSVVLGGTRLVSHIAKFEQLETYVRSLHSALDSHIHTTPSGNSGPPVVPFSAILSGLISAIKSSKAGVSG